jgi:hypothetical protein
LLAERGTSSRGLQNESLVPSGDQAGKASVVGLSLRVTGVPDPSLSIIRISLLMSSPTSAE